MSTLFRFNDVLKMKGFEFKGFWTLLRKRITTFFLKKMLCSKNWINFLNQLGYHVTRTDKEVVQRIINPRGFDDKIWKIIEG